MAKLGQFQVRGSRGKLVDFQITGLTEAMEFIRSKGRNITNSVDLEVFKSAVMVEGEVKESIAGHRAEHQSVDTGLFINNIKTRKVKEFVAQVYPTRAKYPGKKTTVEKVAKKLEYGSSRMAARRHFRNTKERQEKKVRSRIKRAVQKAVSKGINVPI